jgi:putative hydrolase of the HAD superfamily
MEKIRLCGVEKLFDHYLFSGDLKCMKPSPMIYKAAMHLCETTPAEAVMIGDSWNADIVGATDVGIRTIWLSRYGQPCPDPSLTWEIHSLDDPGGIVRYIHSL